MGIAETAVTAPHQGGNYAKEVSYAFFTRSSQETEREPTMGENQKGLESAYGSRELPSGDQDSF